MSFNLRDDRDLPQRPPSRLREARLGGYTQSGALQQTVTDELTLLPPAGAQTAETFAAAVLDLLLSRLVETGELGDGVVIVVSVTRPREEGEQRGMEKIDGFKFSTADTVQLGGSLFVASNSLGYAYRADAACADIGAGFRLLAELGLDHHPAMITDLARRRAVWCPSGSANEDNVESMVLGARVHREESVANVVVQALDGLHREWCCTPGARAGMWAEERDFVAAVDTEKRLQQMIFPVLYQQFRDTHIVRPEDFVIDGRSDISLTKLADRGGRETCVVGITVVLTARESRAGGPPAPLEADENKRAVAEGLDDAVRYQNALECDATLWCIFDMQRTDDAGAMLRAFRATAEERDIRLQRYLVPNSARIRPGRLCGEQN